MLQGAITAEREPHNDVEQISPLTSIYTRLKTRRAAKRQKGTYKDAESRQETNQRKGSGEEAGTRTDHASYRPSLPSKKITAAYTHSLMHNNPSLSPPPLSLHKYSTMLESW